jgi:diguanylate cyclase
MRYHDTKERSHEYLRLAIPLMSRQAAPAHPISYAVWYEYVSGINAALKRDIDVLQSAAHVLSDAQTLELFRKHIADVDETTLNRLQLELHRLLSEVAKSAMDSQQHAADYGATLHDFSAALSLRRTGDGNDPLQQTLLQVLHDTVAIQTTVATLRQTVEQGRSEVEQLRKELERVRDEMHSDGLSGLLNRKGFDEALHAMLSSANVERSSLCLVMLDIDSFKGINDSYGHLFGDRVIRTVAQVLRSSSKRRDVAARYGGEEFALLLPQTPMAGARTLAEQIRSIIAKSSIRRLDTEHSVGSITVSAGVSGYRFGESADAFIGRADSALYAAKRDGRNRVALEAPE